ncbi:MAG: LON peptidase substrate-binding domain-containing protein [Brevundimonas sp.]|uniref:LON peptidase substrate-binding domain-containing protein n=1 Tax=Brevundimonas sp. TaxID=1871086 RepID=UPI0025BD4ACA|nr:LON peptidase substrate-binding domain-containing protein [Brevundimonas sp.]MBX3476722.1 LON peptidase substrate-binding domain-containing protein [Brevundimonas sp.]
MAQGYVKPSDLPQVIPVFPLAGVLVLPRGQLPLNIFEPRYLNMVDDAMAGDRIIGMIQPSGGLPAQPGLARVGCAGRITSFAETSDGRYLITLTGVSRFAVEAELPGQAPYRQVRARYEAFETDLTAPDLDAGFDREPLLGALRPYLESRGLDIDWETAEGAPMEALVNSLSMALPFEPPEKQALLEAPAVPDRAEVLTALLRIDAAGDDEDAPLQ